MIIIILFTCFKVQTMFISLPLFENVFKYVSKQCFVEKIEKSDWGKQLCQEAERIPCFYDHYIHVEEVEEWKIRFPKLTHICIKGWSEKLGEYTNWYPFVKLDLSFLTWVTNVSALGNVHTLDLSWCRRVTDVSALGNIHTLNLWGCTGVTDVSALGQGALAQSCSSQRELARNVHTLDLRGCTGVTDTSMLTNVKSEFCKI